jgi:hypothetical protein
VIRRSAAAGISYLYSSLVNNVDDHVAGIAFDRAENALYVLGSWSKRTDTSTFRFGDTVLHNAGAIGTGDMLLLKFGVPGTSLTVNAGADKTICKGGSTSIGSVYIASGGTAPYSYSWFPSTGLNDASLANPSVTGAMASVRYVVTVTDANNLTARDTVNLIIDSSLYRPEIVLDASPGNSNPFCEGSPVRLLATSPLPWTGPVTWSNGVSNDFNSLSVYTSDTLTVRMTATNGCVGTSLPFITVMKPRTPTPQLLTGDSVSICAGGTATLTAEDSEDPVSYFWSNGSTTPSITVSTAGTYHVSATGSGGCTSLPASTFISVNPLPTGLIAAGGNVNFCSGDSVQLTMNTDALNGVTWSNGSTGTSIWVKTSGTYSATLTSPQGCTNAAQNSITVAVASALPAPAVTAGGPVSFCEGGNVLLTAQPVTGADSYLWSNGVTASSITVTTSGSYWVKAINANGCSSGSSTAIAVTVQPLPTGNLVANGSTSICAGDSVELAINSSAANSFTWNTGAVSQSIWVRSAGSYSAQITSPAGCTIQTNTVSTTAATPVTVSITQSGNVLTASPSGFSYQWYLNGSPVNGATAQTLTITEGGNYSVSLTNNNCFTPGNLSAVLRMQSGGISYQVYPNPASGDFNLQYTVTSTERVNIKLCDLQGQTVHTLVNNQTQSPGEYSCAIKESTYHLKKGYYILTIQIGNRRTNQSILIL